MAKTDNEAEDLRQLLDFSKFGFRGTLTGAMLGLVIVPILVYMLKDSENAPAILIGYCLSLVICILGFGYFSLRRVPEVVANLLKGELALGEQKLSSRLEQIEVTLKELQAKIDAK